MKILIVDNDEDILSSYRIGLEDCGYDISPVNDPLLALEMYKNSNYDLVISDIKMPHMTGLELINQIKSLNKEVLFILVTAYRDMISPSWALNNEIVSLFMKPININELIAKLGEIERKLALPNP